MIAGGFGGIGRAILRWMVKKGARNLIVLSRSGPSSQAAVDTITELTNAGVRIESSPCDITSVSSLSALLHKCSLTFPPIKGCINAAMVLQVRIACLLIITSILPIVLISGFTTFPLLVRILTVF